MGLLDRIANSRLESRVIGGVPWQPWNSPYFQFGVGGPVHPSKYMYGAEASLGLPALYAGSKLLAESAASLPIDIYLDQGNGKHRRWYGPSFFDKPAFDGTIFDWIQGLVVSMVLWGNAWGLITGRDAYGFPTGIEWVNPEYVNVIQDQAQPFNTQRAKVYFYGRLVNRGEYFHIKKFPIPGKLEGVSLIRTFSLTIEAGQEAQRYGVDWYRSGGFPPGVMQHQELELTKEQSDQMKAKLVRALRRREPLVYGRDWDYKPITVPPSEAQFIAAMQLNATQIAALLNLPPDRIGGTRSDSLTYNTTEQSSLQLIEALRPWLVQLELAFFDLLPQRRLVKFNTDALLKTDLEARTNIYQIQRNIGLRTIDELRELEGLEPLPQGIGAEAMPLVLMNAMATRAGGIPKTLLPSIALEMDLAADRLENLEKIGLGTPDAPPPLTQDAASFLASLVNIQRSNPDGGSGQAAAQYLEKVEQRLARLEEDRSHPVQVPANAPVTVNVPSAEVKEDQGWRSFVEKSMAELMAKKDAPQVPEVHVHVHTDDRGLPGTPPPAKPGNSPAAKPAVPVVPNTDTDAKAAEDQHIDNTPGLSHGSGMVSLDVPAGTLPHPDGGVGDHHITLAYLGDNVSDDDLEHVKNKVRDAVASLPGRPEADIGGPTRSFEPSDGSKGKRPDYAPVDADENTYRLHDALDEINKSSFKDDFHPHVTLKYSDPAENRPDDTPVKHVKFTHVSVHRGHEVEYFPISDSLSGDN
jgi:HK97 family phage portal protein